MKFNLDSNLIFSTLWLDIYIYICCKSIVKILWTHNFSIKKKTITDSNIFFFSFPFTKTHIFKLKKMHDSKKIKTSNSKGGSVLFSRWDLQSTKRTTSIVLLVDLIISPDLGGNTLWNILCQIMSLSRHKEHRCVHVMCVWVQIICYHRDYKIIIIGPS